MNTSKSILKRKNLVVYSFAATSLLITLFFPYSTLKDSKINGVNFVAPPKEMAREVLEPVYELNSSWIALTPYAFAKPDEPTLVFNSERQWWGERPEGIIRSIEYARHYDLKIMIKPHVWVRGQGWAGDYSLSSINAWNEWYDQYEAYILSYAEIAQKYNVELFCIGTEYRKAVVARPDLWIKLIEKIRGVYDGKITYAANWDNYQNITFWNQLDYIGIDAYFPISEEKTPSIESLNTGWRKVKTKLEKHSKNFDIPILFTEFGFESRDYVGNGHWAYDLDTLNVSLNNQQQAYSATFESFWNEEWFAGGFIWKWHPQHKQVGGIHDKNFTPQNKPAEASIKEFFGSMK